MTGLKWNPLRPLFAAIAVTVFLAGCVDSAIPVTTPLPDGKGPETPPLLPASFGADSCDRVGNDVNTHEAVFRPEWPPPLQPPADGLVISSLTFFQCDGVTLDGLGLSPFRLAFFTVVIPHPARAGTGPAPDFELLVLQAYTDSPEFRQMAAPRGFGFTLADNLQLTFGPPPPDDRVGYEYSILVERNGSADYAISGMVFRFEDSVRNDGFRLYFHDGAAFHAFRIQLDGSGGNNRAAPMAFGPGSYWAEHSSTRNAPAINYAAKGAAAVFEVREDLKPPGT